MSLGQGLDSWVCLWSMSLTILGGGAFSVASASTQWIDAIDGGGYGTCKTGHVYVIERGDSCKQSTGSDKGV